MQSRWRFGSSALGPASEASARQADADRTIYAAVGWTLLAGLLLSIAVMIAGLLDAAVRGGGATSSVLHLAQELPHLATGDPAAILDLGILLLFATPLVGVLTALAGFAREGDGAFTAVCCSLLVLLILAFAIALR